MFRFLRIGLRHGKYLGFWLFERSGFAFRILILISASYAPMNFGEHIKEEGEAGIRGKNPEKALNPATSDAGVAPHAGAWIETENVSKRGTISQSRPPCGGVD